MMDNLPGNTERKICLCMSVTDCEIAAAFAAGHRTLNDIRATTRACTRCFGCESDLTSFIDDVLVPGKYTPPHQVLRKRAMLVARRLHRYPLAHAADGVRIGGRRAAGPSFARRDCECESR